MHAPPGIPTGPTPSRHPGPTCLERRQAVLTLQVAQLAVTHAVLPGTRAAVVLPGERCTA